MTKMMPKPGDLNALAAAAAKLSMACDSEPVSSARRDRRRDDDREDSPGPDDGRAVEMKRRDDRREGYPDQIRRNNEDSPPHWDEPDRRLREDSPLSDGRRVNRQDSPPRRDDPGRRRRDDNSPQNDDGCRDERRQTNGRQGQGRKEDRRQQDERRQEASARGGESERRREPRRDNGTVEGLPRESDRKPGEPRTFRAKTAVPQDLSFAVPSNCRPGQPVCVQGPHGPIRVPLPQGYQAGERCTIRFGPTVLQQVAVPEGSRPGDMIKFEGQDGEALEAPVPPGKVAGDFFEVTPPVLMVQVPEGAAEGDVVTFLSPLGVEVRAQIPKGMQPTQYFAARIDC